MPTLKLDQDINPFGVDICVDYETPPRAWLDLDALPRLEPHLRGRPVLEVPDIVKRLCGICPTPHHLAGVRALEDLLGISTIPPTAMLTRLLLHHASVIDTFSPRLLGTHRHLAIHARNTGKLLLRTAGCSGHFPDVAVVGGVRAHADSTYRDAAEEAVEKLIAELEQADIPDIPAPGWDGGVDLMLEPHPLGDSIRAGDETLAIHQWPEVVRETYPGHADCRPRIQLEGTWRLWRTGPAVRHGSAGVAALEASCRAAKDLLARKELWSGETRLSVDIDHHVTGVGVGLIDGPRGVLAHLYQANNGVLEHCQILTPTAQNAAWLADMLSSAIARYPKDQGDQTRLFTELECAVRLADPCLPCTHAPAGMMDINIHDQSGRR
ncbi:reducing hydrogenase subunit alpha [Corynebacterium sp. 3HC-13]|uniref:nickel-dependent hydrogenase large subunit n=1 Tax=Corynebacterium poyangense TaxID=2684405 RepID=UPI001CD02BD9|nr:nickel-dependent hydrogenase large subunit [Corynebacterium poyangense]MBZ8176463.1 reducing hydrogenase subunit alpha [Corynebacterium poyangense]